MERSTFEMKILVVSRGAGAMTLALPITGQIDQWDQSKLDIGVMSCWPLP